MQSLHDKKCKSCGTKFVPKQPLQNCCTYDCFIENQNKKAKEKAQKREEKETLVDSIKRYKENPVILKSHDPKKFIKPIAHKSKTTKNTARSLDDETIKEVYARDNYTCIIPDCGKRTLDLPHHAYFGGIQANR